MNIEGFSLADLKRECLRLHVDVSTPGLTGTSRRDVLLQRLLEATHASGKVVTIRAPQISVGESRIMSNASIQSSPPLKSLTLNELRAKCEARGISTVTKGLVGGARVEELARRLEQSMPKAGL